MAYKETIPHYPPYAAASDNRGFISQYFGAGHSGLDSVGNLFDMPVCAIFDGTVTNTAVTATTGNSVTYLSDNGRVKVQYLHLREKAALAEGAKVSKNQQLGREWSSGSLATGKHLHVSLWIDGVLVDPLPYMKGQKELPLGVTDKKEENKMNYQVGNKVKVNGAIAPSAYSKQGTVEGKGKTYTITQLYPGTNFPYQIGATGFVRDADIQPAETAGGGVSQAQYDAVVAENNALKAKIANAKNALA